MRRRESLNREARARDQGIIDGLEVKAMEDGLFDAVDRVRDSLKNRRHKQCKLVTIEINKPEAYHPNYNGEPSVCMYLRWSEDDDLDNGSVVFFVLHPDNKIEVTGNGPRPDYCKRDGNLRFGDEWSEGLVYELDMDNEGWEVQLKSSVKEIIRGNNTQRYSIKYSFPLEKNMHR